MGMLAEVVLRGWWAIKWGRAWTSWSVKSQRAGKFTMRDEKNQDKSQALDA